ncbi:MAG: hypothetical protein J6D30_04945 [Clostridia bacterium]|nr:hypothetical protein [Clostridia bacterium]
MTEDIIQAIKQAEAQAAEMKNTASEQAAQMILDSEKQASMTEKTAMDVCKAYRDTQIKQAMTDAEQAYQNSLAQKEEETKAYCARILENSDAAVSKIVGRIISGDR